MSNYRFFFKKDGAGETVDVVDVTTDDELVSEIERIIRWRPASEIKVYQLPEIDDAPLGNPSEYLEDDSDLIGVVRLGDIAWVEREDEPGTEDLIAYCEFVRYLGGGVKKTTDIDVILESRR